MSIDQPVNLTLNTTTTTAKNTAITAKNAVERGFSQGFDHGLGMIRNYVLIFLLTLVLEYLFVKIADHPKAPDIYAEKYLQKVRSNIWVLRTGLCLVMLFKLTVTHISIGI